MIILFDPSTIATLVPLAVMAGCMAHAARKSGVYPIPDRESLPALAATERQLPHIGQLFSHQPVSHVSIIDRGEILRRQAKLYALFIVLGTLSFSVFNLCSHWYPFASPSDPVFFRALFPLLMNLLLSASVIAPQFYLRQLGEFKLVTGKSGREIFGSANFIFSCSLFTAVLLVSLPLIQYFLFGFGLSQIGPFWMRDVFRAALVFSTIPVSVAGLAIASSGHSKRFFEKNRFLEDNFENFETKSSEELHRLVDAALKSRKLDVADKISQHLLQRAERESEAP